MLPALVEGLSTQTVVEVAASDTHTAALTADGSLYTWGRDRFGQARCRVLSLFFFLRNPFLFEISFYPTLLFASMRRLDGRFRYTPRRDSMPAKNRGTFYLNRGVLLLARDQSFVLIHVGAVFRLSWTTYSTHSMFGSGDVCEQTQVR